MTRLRSFAASARQARQSRFGAAGPAGSWSRVATAALMVLGASSSVLACPQCFGAAETSLVDGTKLGILVLLAVTLAVQGLFVAFFLHLRKRAKLMADVEFDNERHQAGELPPTNYRLRRA